MNDPFVGSLTFHAHLFGQARTRATRSQNSTKGKKERIGRMMMMHSNNREGRSKRHLPATSSRWLV
jgi:elongation factor G